MIKRLFLSVIGIIVSLFLFNEGLLLASSASIFWWVGIIIAIAALYLFWKTMEYGIDKFRDKTR